MATADDIGREQRATVPRIVLPITSRGLEVTDRLCWGLLGIAMLAAAGLILYLNRGTTFFLDELVHVYNSPDFDFGYALEPVNGHLGITSKVVYKLVLETVGAEYIAFRILHVIAVLTAAAVFYAVVKRRIGALPALAPTIVLLFFGSAFSHVVIPIGFGIFVCVAAALGALLALERGDRKGDVIACALLVLAIATFTIGLAFLVGVAIWILLRDDRRQRAWVFLIPLLLYAAWWVWSQGQAGGSGEETSLSNVLVIPSWIFDSLSVVTVSLLGLDYNFAGGEVLGDLGWGRVLAALAVVALVLRVRRGNVPITLWVALGILLSYWCLGALAAEPGLRGPSATRYLYPGAVMVLLVAAEAARGIRFSRLGLIALFAVAAVGVAGNVIKLRDGASEFRAYSAAAKAQFMAIELARGTVPDTFNPEVAAPEAAPVGALAAVYLDVVDRYGSIGFTIPELEVAGPGTRHVADQILIPALGLHLEPAEGPTGECSTFKPAAPGDPVSFELPPGGAVMRVDSREPTGITIGRFDVPSVELGGMAPGERIELAIPTDSSTVPWRAEVPGSRSIRVCGLG